MGAPSKQLQDFMAAYGVLSDEIWEVRRGGAWAIKHAALERVAAEQGIIFERPAVLEINSERGIVCICVFGTFKDRTEWSIGEAAPSNNKNSYPAAMAEKRAKDRVTLKLLNAHGALYSESEADEFEQRQNPHVTRPTDIVPDVEYDQNGHPVDNIPAGEPGIERMTKSMARPEYAKLQSELRGTKTPQELARWGAESKNRVESLPADWQAILRGQYAEHMAELRQGKAA